jgi:hypothetical protein
MLGIGVSRKSVRAADSDRNGRFSRHSDEKQAISGAPAACGAAPGAAAVS